MVVEKQKSYNFLEKNACVSRFVKKLKTSENLIDTIHINGRRIHCLYYIAE